MTTTSLGRGDRLAGLGSGPAARTRGTPARLERRTARLPFALVVLLVLGAGLLALLLLNTVLAQDSFVLYRLQHQEATLADTEQQLQESVTRSEAPSVLASRAADLGMVPGGAPLFLRLPDGAMLGDRKAAQVAPSAPPAALLPSPVRTSPPTSTAASPSTTASPSPPATGSPQALARSAKPSAPASAGVRRQHRRTATARPSGPPTTGR